MKLKKKINYITNYITEINPNEIKALIIVSVTPFYFTSQSVDILENLLNKMLIIKPKLLKKKEKEMITPLLIHLDNVDLKRSFSLTLDDKTEIITESQSILKDEKLTVASYMEDYKNKLNSTPKLGVSKIKTLIFEYKIKFIDEEDNTVKY